MAVKNHNDKTCFLIHMSVPSNSNVSLKIFEKLRKYKDLEIEFSKVWHLKITTLPVVIGALSMVANPPPPPLFLIWTPVKTDFSFSETVSSLV